jgi:glucose 1-dehydrogenase
VTRLSNKVAVVTGAARGIGKGIALALADDGADIVVCDLPGAERRGAEAEVQETVREIEERGRRAIAIPADVSQPQAIARLFSMAVETFGRVDIAVANAAINRREKVVDAQWQNVRRVLEVVQDGVFLTCQAAARQMITQSSVGSPGGNIIAISSVQATMPVPTNAAYGMGKAAVLHFVRILAAELAPHRIRVNAINPGWIDTPGERAFASEEELADASCRLPWGRMGTPHDLGRAAAFLASPDADYITGHTLVVDGGLGVSQPILPDKKE